MSKSSIAKRPLAKLSQPKNPWKGHISTWDIETEGLGGKFLFGTLFWHGEVREFTREEDLYNLMLQPNNDGVLFYAHNGGRYDFGYLLQWMVKNTNYMPRIIRSGERIIGLIVEYEEEGKSVTIEFRDSLALMPASLGALSEKMGIAHGKLKGAINFSNGEIFNPENENHREYARRDVISLFEILEKFFEIMLEQYNLHLKPRWTAASYGLAAWQETLETSDKFWMLPKGERDFLREAYYGGMTRLGLEEVKTVGTDKKIISIDANSHYPAQMKKGVPAGWHALTSRYEKGDIGFYNVTVKVPENAYSIIPLRNNNGTAYPTGEFTTYASSVELEWALAHGTELLKVHRGVRFEKTIFPFAKFIAICERLRVEYKGSPIEYVVKLMQNSVYGKFGMHETSEEIIATSRPTEDMKPVGWVMGEDGHPKQIGNFYVKVSPIESNIFHPEWAAWITAQGRVALSEAIYPFWERGDFIYADTDSVKFRGTMEDLEKIDIHASRYGAFKMEKVGTEMIVIGPKTYAMKYDDEEGERIDLHAKGMPMRKLEWGMYTGEKKAEARIETVKGFVSNIKRGRTIVEHWEFVRKMTEKENVLNWTCEDGKWEPVKIIEQS